MTKLKNKQGWGSIPTVVQEEEQECFGGKLGDSVDKAEYL